MPLAHRQRGADAAFKEGLVEFDAFGRQDSDVNLGLGVVNPHADEALAMILDLDQISVCRGVSQAQD